LNGMEREEGKNKRVDGGTLYEDGEEVLQAIYEQGNAEKAADVPGDSGRPRPGIYWLSARFPRR
jgi:hypothetical protein